jgi:FixJ family two-component response regulator
VSNRAATIFIVDDDDSLRHGLARRLRAEGWNVEAFASAAEFLMRPLYRGIGCALLDVFLPQLTGADLQMAMIARGDTLPVVFLAGYPDVPTAVSAMKRGAVDFLVKPVDDEILLATIAQAIERHGSEQHARLHRQVTEDRLARLSQREREVLNFVVSGRMNKQIAQSMGIAIKTVKVHRARVMQKMGAISVAALVHLCQGLALGCQPQPPNPQPELNGSRVQWRHPANGALSSRLGLRRRYGETAGSQITLPRRIEAAE